MKVVRGMREPFMLLRSTALPLALRRRARNVRGFHAHKLIILVAESMKLTLKRFRLTWTTLHRGRVAALGNKLGMLQKEYFPVRVSSYRAA